MNHSPPIMAAIHLLIFSLLTLTLKPTLSLSLQPLGNNPNFDFDVTLSGDAKIVSGGSPIHLTLPTPSSCGLITYKKPFKFTNPTSFSTHFTFSISPQTGDGLAFVIVPTDFPQKFPGKSNPSHFGIPRETKFLGIVFDTNGNHVGVDVSSLVSSRVSNVSSLNLVLNSGILLKSWVDYDASSKRLEIRLSEMGSERPYDPLIAFPIDLLEMWKGEEVLVGISSSSGNSHQITSVHSWEFRVMSVPTWMHSQPVDPRRRKEHKRSPCLSTVLNGLLLVTGCGALVALIVMFLRAISVNRHAVIPSEYSLRPVDFGYKKVSVVVEKCSENVKN